MIVSNIYVHPLKSGSALAINVAVVEAKGLRFDRQWMLVDLNGKILTQLQSARIALIASRIEGDSIVFRVPGSSRELLLPTAADPSSDRQEVVQIFKTSSRTLDCGAKAAAFFSDYLRQPVRLVRQAEGAARSIDERFSRETDTVSFANDFPLLVCNRASLTALNAHFEKPVPMNRFRPNIVFECEAPWTEELWETITIGAVPFRTPRGCARCPLVGIDQDTAARSREPLATLARVRKVGNKVYFGQNAIPDQTGSIAVGDAIRVTAWAEALRG